MTWLLAAPEGDGSGLKAQGTGRKAKTTKKLILVFPYAFCLMPLGTAKPFNSELAYLRSPYAGKDQVRGTVMNESDKR